jgi:hypothetical protein
MTITSPPRSLAEPLVRHRRDSHPVPRSSVRARPHRGDPPGAAEILDEHGTDFVRRRGAIRASASYGNLWVVPRAPTIPRFSRDAVVRDLRVLADRIRRPLLVADLENQPRLREAIRQHFGKFQSALKAAGLPSPSARPKWSRARIINELRQLHREGIRLTEPGLRAAERGDLVGAVRMYIGTITAARKLARVPGPQRMSKAWIIAEIRACGSKNMPRRLQEACRAQFGTIRAARAAAGVPSRLKVWSKDVIVEELRQRAARGELPDSNLRDACRRHFGSLTVAREAAGVPIVRRRWSNDDLIAEIRRRRGILDHRLRQEVWMKFGSVHVAYAAAGLVPRRTPWTRELVIAELRAGRSDRRLIRAARHHFGSLAEANRAAGREPSPSSVPNGPPARLRSGRARPIERLDNGIRRRNRL